MLKAIIGFMIKSSQKWIFIVIVHSNFHLLGGFVAVFLENPHFSILAIIQKWHAITIYVVVKTCSQQTSETFKSSRENEFHNSVHYIWNHYTWRWFLTLLELLFIHPNLSLLLRFSFSMYFWAAHYRNENNTRHWRKWSVYH